MFNTQRNQEQSFWNQPKNQEFFINKHISENETTTQAFFDFVNSVNVDEWALIDSPTESGKTTAVKKFMTANPHLKCTMLEPFRVLVRNIGEDKINPVIADYGYEAVMAFKDINSFITTYDSLSKLKGLDVVFVDEAHLLAGHSNFRSETLKHILNTSNCKVILLSGTPEIIEDIKDIKKLKITLRKPIRRTITIGGYNGFRSKACAMDIVEKTIRKHKAGMLMETVVIRLNNKDTLDVLFEHSQKNKSGLKVAKYYSDKDGIVIRGQTQETVSNLEKGVIKDIDLLFITSIYDAGLSLEIDKDLDIYAVSFHKDLMPNAIDMIQLSARVRKSSGFKAKLTVLGNFGGNTIVRSPIDLSLGNSQDILDNFSNRYEKYLSLTKESYEGLFKEKYGFYLRRLGDQPFSSDDAKYLVKQSKMSLAKSMHNFPELYNNILEKAKEMDRYSETMHYINQGDEIFRGEKTPEITSRANRVYNSIMDCLDYNISFDLLMVGREFEDRRIERLVTLADEYNKTDNIIYKCIVIEILEGIDNTGAVINIKGFSELNPQQKEQIKTLGGLLSNRSIDWKRNSFKLNIKSEVTNSFANMPSNIKLYADTFLNKLKV